jgi:hypothetical protein
MIVTPVGVFFKLFSHLRCDRNRLSIWATWDRMLGLVGHVGAGRAVGPHQGYLQEKDDRP